MSILEVLPGMGNPIPLVGDFSLRRKALKSSKSLEALLAPLLAAIDQLHSDHILS